MAIVSCPECGKKLKIADTSVGKKVKGPCGHVFVADMAEAAAPAPTPAAPPVAAEKVYVGCTECGAKLKVATTSLGKKMKCPKCTAIFVANLPEEAPAKKPAPEVVFDEDEPAPKPAGKAKAFDDGEPAPKPAGKAKAVVKDEDMDDFLSFAQADAAAESDKEPSFGDDDDDLPGFKGKAKPKKSWDDDEDEDDMPVPKGKAGKKPGKPMRPKENGAADAKPIYPSRLVPTLLATVLLLAFGGLVGAIFFGVNIAKMIGVHEPDLAKPLIKDQPPAADGKGAKDKDKAGKDKDKKPQDKATPVLTPEEKINAAKEQIATLTTAALAYQQKNSEFPKALDDLVGEYLATKDELLDPWKQPYQYEPAGPKNGGKKPDIWTMTPDIKMVIGNWPHADSKGKDAGKDKDKENPDHPEEKIKAAKDQLKGLTAACDIYKLKNGNWPDSLESLSKKDAKGIVFVENPDSLLDPWKKPYQYDPKGPKNNGRHADIWTITPDNEVIGNWPREGAKDKDLEKDKGKELPKDKDKDFKDKEKGDANESDAAKLNGLWKIESAETDGKPDAELKKGNSYSFFDGTVAGPDIKDTKFTVDAGKDPQWIDVNGMPGIYKLDGNTLHWCRGKNARPKEFDSKEGLLLVLKREKK